MDLSLQRSASLGQEVLERASRRPVDWWSTGTSKNPNTTDEGAKNKKTHNDVFASIADLMTQMTSQCKRFYQSGCCTEPTATETSHMLRFHPQLAARMLAPGPSFKTSATSATSAPHAKHHLSSPSEDYVIEVSPGTYAITARMAESEQQTQMVNVKAGESFKLTFNF